MIRFLEDSGWKVSVVEGIHTRELVYHPSIGEQYDYVEEEAVSITIALMNREADAIEAASSVLERVAKRAEDPKALKHAATSLRAMAENIRGVVA